MRRKLQVTILTTALILLSPWVIQAQPLNQKEKDDVVTSIIQDLRKPPQENPRICTFFQRYNDAKYFEELVLVDPLRHFPQVNLSSSELETIRETTLRQYLQALTTLLRKRSTDSGESLPIDNCSWSRPRIGISFPTIYRSWHWSSNGLYNRYEVAKLLDQFSTEDPFWWKNNVFWASGIAHFPETYFVIKQYSIEAAPTLVWLWQNGNKEQSQEAAHQLVTFIKSDNIQSEKLGLSIEETGQLFNR